MYRYGTISGAFAYGLFVTGTCNIAIGTYEAGKEAGCQVIDFGAGMVTVATLPFMDQPVVFESWSQSLHSLESGDVSTSAYYMGTVPNIVTLGTYGQIQTGRQWYNGEITDDEASQRLGSTGVLQLLGAKSVKLSRQTGTRSFASQMTPAEAARYRAYWQTKQSSPSSSRFQPRLDANVLVALPHEIGMGVLDLEVVDRLRFRDESLGNKGGMIIVAIDALVAGLQMFGGDPAAIAYVKRVALRRPDFEAACERQFPRRLRVVVEDANDFPFQ